MALDRRLTREIAQALLRASNKKEGGDIFKNAAQTSTVPGEGGYGEPGFGRAASQLPRLIPAPRPHPFRDPARFSYTGDVAYITKARGIPAYDPLASKVAPHTLSRQENPQNIYGRPLEVHANYGAEHKPTGGYLAGKALGLNNFPAPNAASERAVGLTTQMSFDETGTYQNPEGSSESRNHTDSLRRRSSGLDGTAKTIPPEHSADF